MPVTLGGGEGCGVEKQRRTIEENGYRSEEARAEEGKTAPRFVLTTAIGGVNGVGHVNRRLNGFGNRLTRIIRLRDSMYDDIHSWIQRVRTRELKQLKLAQIWPRGDVNRDR